MEPELYSQELTNYENIYVDTPVPTYSFTTRTNSRYEVRFKPGPELVDDPALGEFVFELAIILIENPYQPKLPPVDALMSVTVSVIINDFFRTKERAAVYVCDDSDSKAETRRKLFDRWFERFDEERFVKKQIPLAVEQNGIQYTAEFVARADNPYIDQLFDSFTRTVSGDK